MDSSIIFTTKKNNNYVFDINKKDLLLCHPNFKKVIELALNGYNFSILFSDNTANLPKELENISIENIKYYYQKYEHLKNSGYFKNTNYNYSKKILDSDIEYSLSNTNQLTFEVTDRCNLNCDYCGYGKYYEGYDQRVSKDLDVEAAKKLIDFILDKKNSNINQSHNNIFYISFYGGEPLMAISFIREIIEYTNQLNFKHNKIRFSMTTNAVLLDKYMDYLVNNNVQLLISLDGNKKNNSYRKYKNNKESFSKIFSNLKLLQNTYPEYFKDNVNFNSVLHNKNSVDEIYSYIKKEFSKKPTISELNNSGIKKSKHDEFWSTYKNYNQSAEKSINYKQLENDMFIDIPHLRNQALFVRKFNKSCFNSYSELLSISNKKPQRTPTGTCLAFSKKIFITVNGKILPCETIDHNFSLGKLDTKGVMLNYKEIAERYNNYYDKMRKLCDNCYGADICTQCVYYLNIDDEKVKCPGFTSKKLYSKKLSEIFTGIEEKPRNYKRMIKEVNFN